MGVGVQMPVVLGHVASDPSGHLGPFRPDGWVTSRGASSRGAAARLITARDAREAVTAAVDLCRGQLGSPTVGVLLEGRGGPWLVSRGVPAAARASLSRVAASVAAADGMMSAVEIGTRLVEAMRPIPAQVVAAGRAALVVGITRSDADERLLSRVAASVQHAAETILLDRDEDDPSREGLAWTAHELRGPLGAVAAILDRLVEGGSSSSEDPVLLRGARDEVVRLLDVVDPLLRCAAGETKDQVGVVDLTSVAMDVINAEADNDPAGGRRFSLEASGALAVRAERSMIVVALGNLVRNATRAFRGRSAREPVRLQDGWARGRSGLGPWARRASGRTREDIPQVRTRKVRRIDAGTRARAVHRSSHRGDVRRHLEYRGFTSWGEFPPRGSAR